jgi:hypothetical protein
MRRRLRHPIRSITEPYGKAGLTVAIFALVLATTGAAFAAGKLTATQKKEVKKIVAAEVAKHPGPAGKEGPAGPAGPTGPAGENGGNGKNGTSATTAEILTSSSTCNHLGGVEVKSASAPADVCNGQTGFTETLPPKKTEKGTWVVSAPPTSNAILGVPLAFGPISFVIPLKTEPEPHFVDDCRFLPGSEKTNCESRNAAQTGACPGTAANPQAEPDDLCVYAELDLGLNNEATGEIHFEGVSPVGAFIGKGGGEPGDFARGTWAVTAPE